MSLQSCFSETLIEAGCDEAGRGCLAGPVYAAAVILPKDYHNELLNDSKKLTAKQREKLKQEIEKQAISWSVASVDHITIDRVNILNASFLAINKAISGLKNKPELLLIDGNRFKNETGIQYQCIIKGDSKYMSIAAASILAKTYRDEFMLQLHEEFPQYGWNRNKSYATKEHREAIIKFGQSPWHRKSFSVGLQTKLEF